MSVDASRFRQLIFQNEIQVEAPTTQPDQFMLAHQFSGYHATRVHASREQVYKAMRSVTAADRDSEHCRRYGAGCLCHISGDVQSQLRIFGVRR